MSKRLDCVRQNVENLIERTGEVGIAFDYACYELGDIDTANRLVRIAKRAVFGRPLLTEMEETILLMLACGYRASDVARRIYMEPKAWTIYDHLARIYTKLGANNATGAVTEALQRKIITLEQVRKLTISKNCR